MAQWYYTRGGQQQGPVEEQALKELLSSGDLPLTELVWREGMGNWQPASSVQEFADSARPAESPPPQAGYAPPAGGEYAPPPGYAAPYGYGAPPGYGAPGQPLGYGGYYPPQGYSAPPGPPPPNHLVGAILATVFCCVPLGIVSIVYAAQVDSKWQAGDTAGAFDASRKAATWMWWSVGSSVLIIGLYIIAAIAAHA
jgi:interferon-induced transmembrane protein/uncharacterized protein DUF4339